MESEGSDFRVDRVSHTDEMHNPPYFHEPALERSDEDKRKPSKEKDRDTIEISKAGREALEAYQKNQDQADEE